ncbi:MAG: CCA tRNA nucleotidyltransferase [Candidatus Micrarchaeota archaeon]
MGKEIFKNILEQIKPSAKEAKEEMKFAKEMVRVIQKRSPKDARVELMGSIAKGTFLKDSKDIDIFILMKKEREKEQLEQIVRKAISGYEHEVAYAEHPYARVFIGERKIDVVPAYQIKHINEKISSVDRTVLHTKYILKNLKKKNGVLLLKKILKANGLYGAEIKTQGFSGYLCELLVIRYNGFMNLMKNASKWKKNVFIDLKKKYTKKEIESVHTRFDSVFIVIDPTDPDRNVAAPVSSGNFKLFVSLCKRVAKKPTEAMFFRKPQSFNDKLKGMKNCYIVSIKKPDVVADILWGQLKKMEMHLLQFLKKKEFKVNKVIADDSHGIRIAISFEKKILPPTQVIVGPPVKFDKNVFAFKQAHPEGNVQIKKSRAIATVPRELRTAEDAILKFFKSERLPSYFDNKGIRIEALA